MPGASAVAVNKTRARGSRLDLGKSPGAAQAGGPRVGKPAGFSRRRRRSGEYGPR